MHNAQPMKIFVVGTRGVPGIMGGVEKHCEELYPRLAAFDNQITVFARAPYFKGNEFVSEWKNIHISYLWCPRKQNIETLFHTLLSILICAFRRPDVVHFHNMGPALFIPVLRIFGIKTVLTYHSINYMHDKWNMFAKSMLKISEGAGIRFADKVIAVSQANKEYLGKKFKRTDIHYVPNGVETPEFITPGDSLAKYGLQPPKYIFSACRLTPEKGILDLVNAYLKLNNPGYKLVIAGDADHDTDYSRKVKQEARRSPNIILTGFISGKPLKELYSNAGLFVLPSHHEGLPIALLEALSYGLPVLVSDIPQNKQFNLPEFRFFAVKNVDDLKNKLIELMEKGISISEQSNQYAIINMNYCWDTIALETNNIFQQLL